MFAVVFEVHPAPGKKDEYLGLAKHLKPILESRPELVELLSHLLARQQHLLAILDEAAIHRVEIEQTDLLSRIRSFFHLNA